MKVAIVHQVAGISAKVLQTALQNNGVECDVFRLSETHQRDFRNYDSVFAYGTSEKTLHKHRFNNVEAVKKCVSKPLSFDAFKAAGVSTVRYALDKKDIPADWYWVTIRTKVDGRKAEGLSYAPNIQAEIPDGELYTEYFEHKYEYRIVVFNGKVVARYFKEEIGEDWFFNLQPKRGFEVMDDHCVRAAKALGIDYVGFDVVANSKKDFAILEANSAARMDDAQENAIVEYYINL